MDAIGGGPVHYRFWREIKIILEKGPHGGGSVLPGYSDLPP
jgi:hypothetical protein